MTAQTMREDREKALAAGMNHHIAKPIEPNELYHALAKRVKPAEKKIPVRPPGQLTAENGDETTFPLLPGIDIQSGLARVKGNRKLYKKLLRQFYAAYKNTGKTILEDVNRGNYNLAEQVLHDIKGASGNISARDLHEAVSQLETRIKQGDYDNLGEPLLHFTICLDKVNTAVTSLDQDTEVVVSTGTCSLEEEGQVDISTVKPLMLKLAHLLENADQDAVNTWETLEKHLEGTCHLDQFRILKQAIDQYDFEKALLYLKETEKLLGVDLEVKDER
jgi:HPt (histidine-containing phosphotransfer) domain-containing protein